MSEPTKPATPPPSTVTPPPRTTTAPHSDATVTLLPVHDESLSTAEPHETVDTQVTWLEGSGQSLGDDDLYARLAAPTV
ncbi:MAG TPA: hypothetical protein VGH63_18400, partial [Polyangia bacterium]